MSATSSEAKPVRDRQTRIDATWTRRFRRRLLAWFSRHARDLPWRKTKDPYAIWVSEVMLQQTQVATVVPYYERFLRRFPDIPSLAAADQQEVLRLWEGLGYYRRARAMHQAAREMVENHNSVFPPDVATACSLPGIGRYTAGAVLSIARDDRAPILEANTQRLLSRLIVYRRDPTSSAGQKLLWSVAEQLLPRKNVGQLNQALMELGAEICTPTNPCCDGCPVATLCPTHAAGLQDRIPMRPRKVAYENRREVAVVIHRRDSVLLRQCEPDERWAGLWDFPRFVVSAKRAGPLAREMARKIAQMTGLEIESGKLLTTIRHGVTRFRITLECHEARYMGRLASARASSGQLRWVRPDQLDRYPLSVTGRKISRLLIESP